MPYLNLDLSYFEHPKTRRLIGILGPGADVYPIRLWAYCARVHPSDGRMRGYTNSEISAIISAVGDSDKIVGALVSVGFISQYEDGYSCHDWLAHEGHLIAFSRRGKVAAKARWKRYATSIAKSKTSNATSNAKKIFCNAASNAPSVPNLTKPIKNMCASKKPAHFVPPNISEVKEYCLERKNSVDAEKWHNFYLCKGWMVGRNKMKDWKAAVRTWEGSPSDLKSNPVPGHENEIKVCPKCFKRLLENEKIFCKSCSWCVVCDDAGRTSAKNSSELRENPNSIGAICNDCYKYIGGENGNDNA